MQQRSDGNNEEGKRKAKQGIMHVVEPVKLYRQPFVASIQGYCETKLAVCVC